MDKEEQQPQIFSDVPGKIPKGSRRKHNKVTFKPYEQQRDYLFPPSTAEYLPANHIARMLSAIIDRIDIGAIEKKFKGGGASAYHPRMLLKIWLLGFIYRIYSTRQLARATREHIAFIWTAANARPDFHTLNNFRLNLEGDMKTIFTEILQLALKLEMIDGKDIFIDHTKMEANANRHKIVWKKNVERNAERIAQELDKIFRRVKEVDAEESGIFSNKMDLSEAKFSKENVDTLIKEVNDRLKEKKISREKATDIKNSLRRGKELTDQKEDYENKGEVLGDRNSFSKTDPDATAMRQKDHVSVKPGYNVGIVTQNQVVLNYGVTNTVSENTNYKNLIEETTIAMGVNPENVTSDAGYGNEENYTYLEEKKMQAFVKYNTYHKEKSPAWLKKRIRHNQFIYHPEPDAYRCPAGQFLEFIRSAEKKSSTGFVSHIRIYQALPEACGICPSKSFCTEGKARSLNINHNLDRLKAKARKLLSTQFGKKIYVLRSTEPETVFGDQINNNKKRRFLLRGLHKVDIEAGIYYSSHNVRKIYQFLMKESSGYKLKLLPCP